MTQQLQYTGILPHPRLGDHSCANFVNFGGLFYTQPIFGGHCMTNKVKTV